MQRCSSADVSDVNRYSTDCSLLPPAHHVIRPSPNTPKSGINPLATVSINSCFMPPPVPPSPPTNCFGAPPQCFRRTQPERSRSKREKNLTVVPRIPDRYLTSTPPSTIPAKNNPHSLPPSVHTPSKKQNNAFLNSSDPRGQAIDCPPFRIFDRSIRGHRKSPGYCQKGPRLSEGCCGQARRRCKRAR